MSRRMGVVGLLLIFALACSGGGSGSSSSGAADPALQAEADAILAELRAERAEERLAAIKTFKVKEKDEVQEVIFWEPPWAPKHANSRTTVYPFFATDLKGEVVKACYVRFNYSDDSWVFWDTLTIKSGSYKATLTASPNQDVGAGRVAEWADIPIRDEPLLSIKPEVVVRLASDDKVIVRFEGRQYHKDHVLTGQEKQAMKAILRVALPDPTPEDALREARKRRELAAPAAGEPAAAPTDVVAPEAAPAAGD